MTVKNKSIMATLLCYSSTHVVDVYNFGIFGFCGLISTLTTVATAPEQGLNWGQTFLAVEHIWLCLALL